MNKILRTLTAKQFVEWEAYYQLEPFGELRSDYRAASIREMIHNVNVKKEHRKPIKEFVLKWGDDAPKRQSWQEMKSHLMTWAVVQSASKE